MPNVAFEVVQIIMQNVSTSLNAYAGHSLGLPEATRLKQVGITQNMQQADKAMQ